MSSIENLYEDKLKMGVLNCLLIDNVVLLCNYKHCLILNKFKYLSCLDSNLLKLIKKIV